MPPFTPSREDDDDDEEPPGGANGRWSPLSGAGLEEMVREATRLAAQLQQCQLSPLPPGQGRGSPRSPRRETFVVKDSPVRALLPTVPAAGVPKVGGTAGGWGGGPAVVRGAVCIPVPPPSYRSPPALTPRRHPGEPPAAGGPRARAVPPGRAHPGGLWRGAGPSPSVQGQQVMGWGWGQPTPWGTRTTGTPLGTRTRTVPPQPHHFSQLSQS